MFKTLTESERNNLAFALRIAAERYQEDARVMRAQPNQAVHERLAVQFDKQSAEALQLADDIDNAKAVQIELHPDTKSINVTTRDLGNGSEEMYLTGRFTGEVDTWGKHTFVAENGQTYYLFEDEWTEN